MICHMMTEFQSNLIGEAKVLGLIDFYFVQDIGNSGTSVQQSLFSFSFFLFFPPVLPAGAVDVAGGSAAEAGAAVLPGSAGRLHRVDPHFGLQASSVRRVGGLRPRGPDCLLGGESAHHHRRKTAEPAG